MKTYFNNLRFILFNRDVMYGTGERIFQALVIGIASSMMYHQDTHRHYSEVPIKQRAIW